MEILKSPTKLPESAYALELTHRELLFAQHYVENRNALAAYRAAYDVGTAKNSALWTEAKNILRRPHVARKCRELQDEVDAATVVRAVQILQDCVDIFEADPNELIAIVRDSCRFCHGVGFAYQWRDAMELAKAHDRYRIDLAACEAYEGRKPPERPIAPADASGGFGFDHTADPHPGCATCYGEGVVRHVVQDTTKLSPRARKLFKGVEVKGNGDIKILMHDQMQARDMAIKMIGGYKDASGTKFGGTTADHLVIDEGVSQEQAAAAYMKLVKG